MSQHIGNQERKPKPKTTSPSSTPRTARIWLIRHAEILEPTDPSFKKSPHIPYDPPLTSRGHLQSHYVGQFFLKRESVAHIFSSPFLRCIETASRIADVLDLSVKVEHGIAARLDPRSYRNRDEDISTAINLQSLKESFPRIDTSYVSRVEGLTSNEALETVRTRMKKVIKELTEEFRDDGSLLFVGHSQMLIDIPFILSSLRIPTDCIRYCTIIGMEKSGLFWRCSTKPTVPTRDNHSC
eukprot:TRINITY_DN4013_c0_g1_i1.p1 TRINITY_DN4013_c0_g1~~TRINITY_DN4013_c0_g1_i1.p1  ORF type:complete len:240 (+),score=16.43 TRINITY_DN4013_c0_g1_i1:90-809(+)